MKKSDDVLEILGPAAMLFLAVGFLHNRSASPVARQIAQDIEKDAIEDVSDYFLG